MPNSHRSSVLSQYYFLNITQKTRQTIAKFVAKHHIAESELPKKYKSHIWFSVHGLSEVLRTTNLESSFLS